MRSYILASICAAILAVPAGAFDGGKGDGGKNGQNGQNGKGGKDGGDGGQQPPFGGKPPKPTAPTKPTKPLRPTGPEGPPTAPGVDPRDVDREVRFLKKQPPTVIAALAADERLYWGVGMSGSTGVAAIHDAERVYAASDNGEVTAWNTVDGEPAWTAKLGSGFASRGVLVSDRLVVALRNGELVALNTANGSAKHSMRSPGAITSALALAGETVVGLTSTGMLITVDPATFAFEIVYRAIPATGLSAPVIYGSTAIFTDRRGLVRSVDVTTGAEVWTKQIYGAVEKPLVLVSATTTLVLVGTLAGELAALDAETGDELWRAHGFSPYVGAVSRGSDLLAVFSNRRALLIKSDTGVAAGTFTLRNVPAGAPILDGTGFLVPTEGDAVEVYDAQMKSKQTLQLRGGVLDAGESDGTLILSTDVGEVYRWRTSP